MDFSNRLIGKSLDDLQYEDIEDYFQTSQEESDLIEFKSFSLAHGNFNTNIEGIIRGVAALLNSGGGIIIWGAPVGVREEGNDYKTFKGNLSPLKEDKDKDWLINKVSDSITPLPIGIKVVALRKGDDYVYVFEVQQSQYSPHQYKQTYWARLDGQTKPAPHYLIEALFRRIKYPNIEGYIKIDEVFLLQNPSRYQVNFTIALFNFSRLQNEENVIYRLVVSAGRFMSAGSPTLTFNEPLLHFGTPMVNSQQILIGLDELKKAGDKINIILTYGGKKSPVKSSHYILNMDNINLDNPKYIDRVLESMDENKLLADIQDQKGTTRERLLEQFLGRKVK